MTTKTTMERAAGAGARVPADRAVKAEATGERVKVTVEGFEFEFDPDVFDDDDLMTDLEHGNPHRALLAISSGPEQVEKIRNELRGENGVLKRSDLLNVVVGALEAAGQGKSSPSRGS